MLDYNTFIFLQKYSLAKKGAAKDFLQALSIQKYDDESLRNYSFTKFKALVKHAYNNTPYYKKKFDLAQISPNDIIEESDIAKIPILTRSEIIEHFDEFFAINVKKSNIKISTTGGSTGTPLKVGFTANQNREIPKWIMLNWWGLNPTVNTATIYREIPISKLKKNILTMIYYPQKVLRFNATKIDNIEIEKFIKEINKLKPELIHGYVGAIDVIANYLIDNDISLEYSPKVIWLTASPITKIQENKISKAFNSVVCDQYGCSEMYYIAAECPQKEGLHVFSTDRYLEILDSNDHPLPVGEMGKITLTNLNELNFPLIRYQNGDESRLIPKKCKCGINLPLMDKIKGRISDNISIPDGTILSGEYLTCLFDDFTDYVKQFQVIQNKDSTLEVKIVFFEDCSLIDEIIEATFRNLSSRIKDTNLIKITKVNKIDNINGKLRFIISEK